MEKEMVKLESTYKDMVGEVHVEDSFVNTSLDLYELAGLDHREWSILSVDAFAFSHGAEPKWNVYVNAFRKADWDVEDYNGMKALEAERGSIPVHNILLHDVTFEDYVRTLKSIHFQVKSQGFPLQDIVARGDHPEQE